MGSRRSYRRLLDILTGQAPAAFATNCSLDVKSLEWTQTPDIRGFGIGFKQRGRRAGQELSLRVYVAEKRPTSRVAMPIPSQIRLRGFPTIRTDVIELGRLRLEANTDFIRPVEPGYSIGPVGTGAGTFGCLVEQRSTPGTRCVLSNFHVLTGNGRFGKETKIFQPSPSDGPTLGLTFATLLDWVPINYQTAGYPNRVDAAIARVLDSASVTSSIHGLNAPVGVNQVITERMPVQIVGSQSDPGRGTVTDPDCRLIVDYPLPQGGTIPVGFSDQVLCTRYSVQGDSGSAVLDSAKNVVGLHFMGSDEWSAFNKIDNVMAALDLRLVTV